MTEAFDYIDALDEFGLISPARRWNLPEWVDPIRDALGDPYFEFRYRESERGKLKRRPLTQPPRWMLEEFVEIASADEPEESNRLIVNPAAALSFARRYGALGVCAQHNLSCWHTGQPCQVILKRHRSVVRLRERVEASYAYSRVARAILNLAAKPKAPRRRADFNRLQHFFGRPVPGPATAVNYWLRACRFDLRFHGDPPRLDLFPLPSVLANLGIQLALVVARRRGVAVCAGCCALFLVNRQPRQDRNHYCKKCGKKAEWLDAQRRRRAKLKQSSEGDKADGTQT